MAEVNSYALLASLVEIVSQQVVVYRLVHQVFGGHFVPSTRSTKSMFDFHQNFWYTDPTT